MFFQSLRIEVGSACAFASFVGINFLLQGCTPESANVMSNGVCEDWCQGDRGKVENGEKHEAWHCGKGSVDMSGMCGGCGYCGSPGNSGDSWASNGACEDWCQGDRGKVENGEKHETWHCGKGSVDMSGMCGGCGYCGSPGNSGDSGPITEDWVGLIEGTECPSNGEIICKKTGVERRFQFPAGVFHVPRQVWVPENTVIEGVANPNAADKTAKPNYESQTIFIASSGVSDGNACYCQNLEKSWEPESWSNPYHCKDLTNEQVRSLRPGFLMFSNTAVRNIAFQGKDTTRPSDNGALCGGGVFETPGCVHNQCKFDHLKTGDGKPVKKVLIENVRLNDYSNNPKEGSQLAVWVAQTSDTQIPTSEVTVKNLVAMFLHADGINFHGFVQNALVDDSYIQNTGDDIYAVWGSNFDTRDIVFQNSVAVDAGRARDNRYGSCVAVYGAKQATFQNLQCFAPDQNTGSCYDSKNRGETCNGCLGIIKESFDADYKGSVFTFANNEFYSLKSNGPGSDGRYDLSSPMRNDRPEVCNNEWKGGGLRIENR